MEMFRNCGWASFAVLGVGILATLLGVAALALAFMKPRTSIVIGIAALIIALGVPGVGVIGMFFGREQTDAAIRGPSVSPEQKERIREVGYDEAGQCVQLGGTIGVLPLVMAAIAIVVAGARKGAEKVT